MSSPDFGPHSLDPTLFDYSSMVEEDRNNRQREAFQVEARPVRAELEGGRMPSGHIAFMANHIDANFDSVPQPPSETLQ
jgi:hypothetical protein